MILNHISATVLDEGQSAEQDWLQLAFMFALISWQRLSPHNWNHGCHWMFDIVQNLIQILMGCKTDLALKLPKRKNFKNLLLYSTSAHCLHFGTFLKLVFLRYIWETKPYLRKYPCGMPMRLLFVLLYMSFYK